MSSTLPLISICVPVYNEELNIEPFHQRVSSVIDGLADRYRFEILFTDNHSTDTTFERLAELSRRDHRVRVIRFSRNFGFQRSILTNYMNARGEAAIQLDVDLQDPPELIEDFLRHWEEGYKVVYGIRRERPNESMWLHALRKGFYRLVDYLSEETLPHDAGDFRLVDRCVLEQLKLVSDQQPYLRGLIASMGFRQTGIVYDRSAREFGSSKFNLMRLFGLALDGILQHSVIPLRIAIFLGLIMSGLAALAAVYYLLARIFFGADWPPGVATSTILTLLSIGMNALLLGIIGEYIGRIYKNVKRMPITISEAVIDHMPASNGLSEAVSTDHLLRANYINGH
ncbi:glycosyltransferase family 2 protein [Microvirga sp. 2YAF29]|uniref:glycosyltransferase family 2 protein n=1 Tax=Microvirga sp. 2YAF29 TaxID=3233031 RepID=UPI003F9E8F4E